MKNNMAFALQFHEPTAACIFQELATCPAGPQGHLLKKCRMRVCGCAVCPLTDNERALLEKLADAGKPTELGGAEAIVGKTLERAGLVLFVRNSASAVITPKGRHAITAVEFALKGASPKKPPLGFLS